MEDIIWERIKSLDSNCLNFIQYYKLDINLNYSEIESLYKNYLSKYYFESESNNIFSDNEADKISLKLCLFEPELAIIIEQVFESNLKDLDDDLILFYLRKEKSALLLFKTYYPLSLTDEVKLPYFCYYIQNVKTLETLESRFEEEENLCIMSCSS